VSEQLDDRDALAPAKELSIFIEEEVSLTPRLFGEEKNLLALPVIKALFLFRPDRNIVATVITLSGLLDDQGRSNSSKLGECYSMKLGNHCINLSFLYGYLYPNCTIIIIIIIIIIL